ncbi:hypothetical protein ACJX0J_006036 [Zea mays]
MQTTDHIIISWVGVYIRSQSYDLDLKHTNHKIQKHSDTIDQEQVGMFRPKDMFISHTTYFHPIRTEVSFVSVIIFLIYLHLDSHVAFLLFIFYNHCMVFFFCLAWLPDHIIPWRKNEKKKVLNREVFPREIDEFSGFIHVYAAHHFQICRFNSKNKFDMIVIFIKYIYNYLQQKSNNKENIMITTFVEIDNKGICLLATSIFLSNLMYMQEEQHHLHTQLSLNLDTLTHFYKILLFLRVLLEILITFSATKTNVSLLQKEIRSCFYLRRS